MFSIYRISNSINDKVYIGQTIKSLLDRFKFHTYKSSHCLKLYNSIKKHGEEKFRIELIASCDDQLTADWLEIFWIKTHNSVESGYNISHGGAGGMTGRKHTEEARRKISETQKGRPLNYVMTDEVRAKMSASKMGHAGSTKLTKQQELEISRSNLGINVLAAMYNVNRTTIWRIRKNNANLRV